MNEAGISWAHNLLHMVLAQKPLFTLHLVNVISVATLYSTTCSPIFSFLVFFANSIKLYQLSISRQ